MTNNLTEEEFQAQYPNSLIYLNPDLDVFRGVSVWLDFINKPIIMELYNDGEVVIELPKMFIDFNDYLMLVSLVAELGRLKLEWTYEKELIDSETRLKEEASNGDSRE